jgi:hypothetical protein
MNVDLNLELDGPVVRCRHCGTETGDHRDPFRSALRNERKAQDAGPGVHADSSVFSDRRVILRQRFCPGCLTALSTEIVPAGEEEARHWRLDRPGS